MLSGMLVLQLQADAARYPVATVSETAGLYPGLSRQGGSLTALRANRNIAAQSLLTTSY